VDYTTGAGAVFDLHDPNVVLMEVILDGDVIGVGEAATAMTPAPDPTPTPSPSMVAGTLCTPQRVLSRSEMMDVLLKAPPSSFVQVDATDPSGSVTFLVKSFGSSSKDEEEVYSDDDFEDKDEEEEGEAGDVDLDLDEPRDTNKEFIDEEWQRVQTALLPLRRQLLAGKCTRRYTLTRQGELAPETNTAIPSHLIVQGPLVYRAT
jgi:hypothetical protein